MPVPETTPELRAVHTERALVFDLDGVERRVLRLVDAPWAQVDDDFVCGALVIGRMTIDTERKGGVFLRRIEALRVVRYGREFALYHCPCLNAWRVIEVEPGG